MLRQIITIDEEKCNGCGLCVPNCPEGALRIIDGKARLVSDLFCDGLGACIGHCPEGAITIEEREAGEYEERKVMENVVKHGSNTIRAHLEHLLEHAQHDFYNEAVSYLEEHDIEIPGLSPELMVHEEEDGVAGNARTSFSGHSPDEVNQEGIIGCDCPGATVMDFRESEEHQPTTGRSWPGSSRKTISDP